MRRGGGCTFICLSFGFGFVHNKKRKKEKFTKNESNVKKN